MNKIKLQQFLSSTYTKLIFGISLLYSSVFIANAYGLPIVNKYSAILQDTRSTNNFTLTAIANNNNNNVSLNWSLENNNNKIFKVYKKIAGNNQFQSISTTNFESNKQVRVLNIYPNAGAFTTFTTWDKETVTVPLAASLKKWMEEPNSENSQGYGKGIIEVTPVSFHDFNNNPSNYLFKNSDGNWNYDVIMIGTFDANNTQDISDASLPIIRQFIEDGRGILFGHDSIGYIPEIPNIRSLASYLNLVATGGSHDYRGQKPGLDISLSSVKITKRGLLTNYPWNIGDIGTELTVPSTHSLGQIAHGDIWMKFNGTNDSYSDNSNFYLTSWNNAAMIQTGHSNGAATPDEQKLLANTLFYLNQLSTSTSLVDNDGQDVTAPELPKLKFSSSNTTSATYSIESIKDIGTNYEYYVIAEDKNGSTSQSNTVTTTVTSGLKGYSYIIDNSPNTEPNNEVNLNTSTKNISVDITDNNKDYYIHIKSIDNRNNASKTVHIQIDIPKLTATANNQQNNVSLNWSLVDAKNKIYKVYKKRDDNNTFQSISTTNFTDSKQVKVLNIHPNVGAMEYFSTWDGETLNLPKSASLKRWMEEPQTGYPKGYGMGIIEVDVVTQADFNANPTNYLKNLDGTWKYDVVVNGFYDNNGGQDLTDASMKLIREFVVNGRGYLCGHDTMNGQSYAVNNVNANKLRDLLNIKFHIDFNNTSEVPMIFGNVVQINKKGLLLNYPHQIGEIGTKLNVPLSHSTAQLAYGDIWMTYSEQNATTDVNGTGTNNFYLTSWNNTAMIQTGHSNGNATPDEQKILANTLFYLNQLSTSTSLTDNDGQDVTAPELPKLKFSSSNINSATYSIESIQDIGTNYEYYVIAEDKTGNTFKSNTVKTTVTSGLKGYSYIIDNSPNTEPNNVVNINSTSNTIDVNIADTNKDYYIHIKSIDNRDNASKTVHIKIDAPKLTATANNKQNNISLNWSLVDATNKIFKVYKKMEGNTTFQSISSTNFESVNQVKVLNVYPPHSVQETYTTWRGEKITLPISASLKKWMEEPNVENSKGYGKGIIAVDTVLIDNFNSNPDTYLKNPDGSYKYDVIMFGTLDSNGSKDLSTLSLEATKSFIESGRGVLFGHDTVSKWGNRVNFPKLEQYINIKTYDFNTTSDWSSPEKVWNIPWSGGTDVIITKKGVLTNYPWNIGESGTTLKIPYTHTNSQIAKGDVWMKFSNPTPDKESNVPISTEDYSDNGVGTNMAYLTTYNNTAMIQTGHAINRYNVTIDEQKLLANTLFYLNQLSSDTSLIDNSGQDVKAPDAPSVNLLSTTSSAFNFDLSETKDNGSTYEYYVVSEDKLGNKLKSNTVSATITTGIKGYSYVLDEHPTTEPSNTINITSNNLTINNANNNKIYYLHIKAIDNANNVSKTTHFKISTSAPIAPVLNLSRTGWGTTDARFTITQNHNKDVKILSISTASSTPFIHRLQTLGYNVTSNPNLTNIEEIKQYDIVIADYYCWTVTNGAFLEKLYNNGVKLITVGNDTGNSILPILSTKSVGSEANLTIGRNIKNEATFAVPSYNPGIDSSSAIITKAIASSTTWYTTTSFNAPSILSMQNGKGGEWIHSQCILGGNGADELIMGFIDYLTHSISQVHLQDVQYKINDGNWISYNGEAIVLSHEGNYNISVRNIDTRGVASVVDTQTVGIDRTAPKGIAYTNQTTTSRNITVTLDSLEDKLSGLNKVRISNYRDFRDSAGYTSISNKISIDLKIELPFISNLQENYSSRTVYIELQDNVGNKRVLQCSTIYEPKKPTVTIISPKNDTFVTSNESIPISWDYQDNNNDNIVLPQSKAIITATQLDSNNPNILSITVTGTSTKAVLPKLETGEYSITVTVYNSFDKFAVSEPIYIRCNIHHATGHIQTIPIVVGSPLRYISVVSDVEIPTGTEIKGYIYYSEQELESFSEQNKIAFTIASNNVSSDILKLPNASSKIKIYYELYNKTTNKQLSPALCRIIVLGK